MLRQIIKFAATLAVSATALAGEPPELAAARGAADEFMGALMQRLLQEIKAGGATQAVSVCSEVGLQIPAELSRTRGIMLRRTTLKPRNPQNAPDATDRAHLDRLAALHAQGNLPADEWEIIEHDGRPWLSYRRPIRLAPLCVQCHGPADQIAPAIRALLKEKYPADQATGYRPGDLRGMVTARLPLGSATAESPASQSDVGR